VTGRATFGDFAAAARAYLEDAVPPAEPVARRWEAAVRTWQTEAFTASLRGVIEVMTRYLADITAPVAGVSLRDRGMLNSWARAGMEAQDALGYAAAFLPSGGAGTGQPGQPGQGAAIGSVSGGLDAAAVSMRTGRDLLHTHFRIGPDGARRDHSEWAQVIASGPVTRALLLEVASWARQIAPQGAALALSRAPAQRDTAEARRRLNAACQWLWVLDSAVQAAHRNDPVSAEDVRLLYAVPVNAVPDRRVPDGTETVQELCHGALGSAERVRHVAWLLPPQAAWSPGLTSDSLRQSARCATVISHHCEILLRSLAARAAGHGDAPLSTGLLASADAAGHAREAWLRAARGWNLMTTDTRGIISPAAAEAADLALWTGRMAYADPGWTLDLGPAQATRPPEALAPEPGEVRGVVAAVHHACHTLTQIAAADQEQIRTAASAGRLLVPTRSLPDSFDIPRAFAHAPGDRIDQVLADYRGAGVASSRANAAVADVAYAIRSPSQMLTAARAAVRAGGGLASGDRSPVAEPAAVRHWSPRAAGPVERPSIDEPAGVVRWSRNAAGPVERTLRDLGVTSQSVLLRAAAIDQAGEQIILDNAPAAGPRRRHADTADLSRSTGTAELINHMLASGDPRAAAVLGPAAPAKAGEAEAEP
jgi:hypothetical protein